MEEQCIKCSKIFGSRDRKSINFFINEQGKNLTLCTNCYFDLSKDEKKKLIHTGIPYTDGKFKPQGLVFGGLGSISYSSGQNSGAHWMLNRRMKKKKLTQKQVDEMSIDKFNTHWDFLTIEAKQELLEEL